MTVPNASHESAFLPGELSLRDVLTVVFKRRKLIAVFASSVVGLVVAVILTLPPVYEVSATLIANRARVEVPLAPTDSSRIPVNYVTEQDLNSEVEILKSRSLIEDVLRTLGVDESVAVGDGGLGTNARPTQNGLGRRGMSPFDKMVVDIGKELTIKAIPRSSLIRISYRSKDPEQATSIVKTLTERYVEQRVERYRSPQVVSFFETQMRDAEERLRASETALNDFSDAAGVTMTKGPLDTDSLAAEKQLLMERLAGFENDLGDAEASVEEQSQRMANLKIQLAAEPERLPSASRNNKGAATEAFEGQLAALQLERDRLLQDFKPDSRYVRDVDTQIALVQERLSEAQLDVAGIDGTETNPIHQNLKGELLRTEAELAGTRGRIESLRGQVADSRRDLERLNVNAFKVEILRRDQQAAEDEYLLYRKKFEEARISEAMDQERLVNVSIAEPAQMPLRPVQRNLKLTLVAAILLGVVGGLGLAFVVEFLLDHTFTTGEGMERRLGLVHLASIPEEV